MISQRAEILVQNPSAIVTAAIKCAEDPYSKDNPNGYLNFGVAQNFLMENEIVNHIRENHQFETSDIHYNPLNGKESLRETFAKFAQKYLKVNDIDPSFLTVQCGVSALCESLAYCLFNEGDTLLMAAPYYPGFFYDFTVRFGVKIETVQLKKENHYRHQFSDFKNQIDKTNPKAILLTNPYNPTGEVLSREFQDLIVEYCQEKNIHIIADEIYTLTRLDQKSHHSFLNYDYENIHYLYGMAKDFALAGLRVGFFYTRNIELNRAMQNISYFHSVSTQSQNSVQAIFNDHHFLDHYISKYKIKLTNALNLLKSEIPKLEFEVPDGGFFIFANFEHLLKDKTKKAELDFFNYLMQKHKVNINPASTMGFERPGFFRICYAKSNHELIEFSRRVNTFLS